MNYIELKLKEKTENTSQGEVYFRQWMLAKEYLPKLLNTISHIFPHYSLHDASHSETILNNIVRIVGKHTIDKLSVVDLWFLLTASYYHDCGMVLLAEDKERIFEFDEKFADYLIAKQKDMSSPMKDYADTLTIKDRKIYFAEKRLTVKTSEAVRYLIADYIRPHHASRSGDLILSSSSLHLPGNPIPERIIRILANICETHTKSTSEVMNLPFVECSGCGIEDCHPRYIAALLRLGDLLDMDSNRVSDVLLGTLGSIPIDSIQYNATNRSITHLRIDESNIEVEAICHTYDVYDLMTDWLRWLNEEVTFMTNRWRSIVPDISYGYLPSVGSLEVKLLEYDTIDGKVRPAFQIDTSKAIELLQGAGLYDNPAQCIRELLQNSVDATYLRIFQENPNISSMDEFIRKCKSYPISLNLQRTHSEEEFSYWSVEIIDNGIGMDKEDLKFLCKTGSSSKNTRKSKLISLMPDWMKPSGIFGIGFQSVFLVTDSVTLSTRKHNSGDAFEMVLNNPSGSSEGSILLKTLPQSDKPVGTSLSFVMKEPKRNGWSVKSTQIYAIATINTYDFAKDDSLDVRIAKILDEISMFSEASLIDINLNFNDDLCTFSKDKPKFDFYDEDTGLQISLGQYSSRVFYRNQYLRSFDPGIMFIKADVNIMTGKANEILTLNRDNVRDEMTSSLKHDIALSLSKFLIKAYPELPDEIKPHASMYLTWNKEFIISFINENYTPPSDWMNYKVSVIDSAKKESAFTLGELLLSESVKAHYGFSEGLDFSRPEREEDGEIYRFPGDRNNYCHEVLAFVRKMIGQHFTSFVYTKDAIIVRKDRHLIEIEDSDEARLRWMKSYMHKYYARGTMPCPERFSELEINPIWRETTFSDFKSDYPVMICPFIRKYENDGDFFHHTKCLEYDVDDKVIDFTYNNRKHPETTKEDIAKAYERLKEEYANALSMM